MQDIKVTGSGGIILLGKQGENLARRIRFDLARWIALYGDGVAELICQRPGEDTVYPVAITQDGPVAVWEITATDTARHGVGHCELRYYVGDTLAKSETWMTKVGKAMEGDLVQPPDPGQSWAEQVVQVGADAKAAADAAAKSAGQAAASAEEAAASQAAAENSEANAAASEEGSANSAAAADKSAGDAEASAEAAARSESNSAKI